MAEALEAEGAEAIIFPTIQIEPIRDNPRLDRAVAHLADYDWMLFTSVNGVSIVFERMAALGRPARVPPGVQVGAIGPATAEALRTRGVQAALVPDEFVAEGLIRQLGDVQGKRLLLPRAAGARPTLPEELERRGATVDEIPVYDTRPASPDAATVERVTRGVDAVTFTSPSTVEQFLALLSDRARVVLADCVVACIGPVTAAAADRHGIRVDVTAREYTTAGLVDALIQHFAGTPLRGPPVGSP